MAQVTYRGVKYDTARPSRPTTCRKVEESYRGVKHTETICREEVSK